MSWDNITAQTVYKSLKHCLMLKYFHQKFECLLKQFHRINVFQKKITLEQTNVSDKFNDFCFIVSTLKYKEN